MAGAIDITDLTAYAVTVHGGTAGQPMTSAESREFRGISREAQEPVGIPFETPAPRHRTNDMSQPSSSSAAADIGERYLDLLESCLCGLIYRDRHRGWGVEDAFDAERRNAGRDWPQVAHTMIGRTRLTHLRRLVERVLDEGIPGDFIEAGVWRGGACVLMRGVLAARGVTDRVVHLADSFCGLPPPDANYPADAGSVFHQYPELAVPRSEVEEIFRRYGLLDDQVRFHEGWFKDTLPRLGSTRFALIRLDGDMYESTWTALSELYPRLNSGGFAVIDDYNYFETCRLAVDDYRARHRILAPIEPIDWSAVFWRKS